MRSARTDASGTLRFRGEGATREAVLPGAGSTPNLDSGGFNPNKDVTITKSGPGPLIPVRRRISEDWFPHGPGHEMLLPITNSFFASLRVGTRTKLPNAFGQLRRRICSTL